MVNFLIAKCKTSSNHPSSTMFDRFYVFCADILRIVIDISTLVPFV